MWTYVFHAYRADTGEWVNSFVTNMVPASWEVCGILARVRAMGEGGRNTIRVQEVR